MLQLYSADKTSVLFKAKEIILATPRAIYSTQTLIITSQAGSANVFANNIAYLNIQQRHKATLEFIQSVSGSLMNVSPIFTLLLVLFFI